MNMEELKTRRAKLKENSDVTLRNMDAISKESLRVARVAHDAGTIIENLDQEFETQTGLRRKDVKFLFAAIGLQMARIVILNELTKIEPAGTKNRNETKLHDYQKTLLQHLRTDIDLCERPYHASLEHIITKMGVPYDATASLTDESINKLLDKGKTWGFDLESMIPPERVRLFKGANHRFATLGHDPWLGLIFGTANIMTNTITCVRTPIAAGSISIPVLTTNHVVYTSAFTDPRIAMYGSTGIMLQTAIERTKDQPSAFVAALIKQIIHIGTDLYTPCGISIPGANLVLSNSNVEQLTRIISFGDLIKIGSSATLAELINLLISTLHTLMYDDSDLISRDLYSVRTRKIILYSNLIATGSNVLWVTANMLAGNEAGVKQLDIGGLMVTLQHLMTDTDYIRKIKEEFVLGGFRNKIKGENLALEELKWDLRDCFGEPHL